MPITVRICSYDNGEPKIALTRTLTINKGTDKEKHFPKPIGRMNEEEVCELVKLLGDDTAVRVSFTRVKQALRAERTVKRRRKKRKKKAAKPGDVITPTVVVRKRKRKEPR